MATTWNPSDKHADVTLSGGNLTATNSTSTSRSARATESKNSGKYYFEVVSSNSYGSTSIGLADAAAGLDVYVGSSLNGYGYVAIGDGYVRINDIAYYTPGPYGAGDVVGVAYDQLGANIYFYLNGVLKVTHHTTTITGEMFPAVSVRDGRIVEGRFLASSFSYSPPSGYSAWDSSAEPVVDKSWLMTLFNGAIKGIKGVAKSAIPFYDGDKWEVKEAGTPGQVLGINDTGDLDWKTLIAGADLIEIADQASLPGVGAVKTIYLALDTNKLYYWKTNAYRELAPSVGGSSNITVGYTAPADPEINHVWIDLNEGGIILTPEQVIPNALLVPPVPSMGVTTQVEAQ